MHRNPKPETDEAVRQDDAVIVALGSNLPGPYASIWDLLEAAIARLGAIGVETVARSRWWRSTAWPDRAAPDYLNGIILVETVLPPRQLLSLLLSVEREFGRDRAEPNAPRTLDLDLVAYGRRIVSHAGAVIPHPRAGERFFVMGPLSEIAPAWTHPLTGETVGDLAKRATIGADALPASS